MNATLDTVEQEVRQQVQQNIDAFTMPKPMRGQSVLFYRNGTKGGQPEVGFILKVGTRNLMVMLASGIAQESVRHIDDPRLQLNDAQRACGAWDFTDDWKAIQTLTTNVAALTAKVEELLK